MLKLSPDNIAEIAKQLRSGAVVAIPTETVYGLAIALDSPSALEKLIYLKHREIGSGKIFTLVPANKHDIGDYAMLTHFTETLIKQFVPGDLTLILHKNPAFRHPYFNHFKTIGVRIPRSPLFRDLLPESGPLLLTSANPRGAEPASTSTAVAEAMPHVDVLVEGRSGGNPPSTILDCTTNPARILRQGRLKFSNFPTNNIDFSSND